VSSVAGNTCEVEAQPWFAAARRVSCRGRRACFRIGRRGAASIPLLRCLLCELPLHVQRRARLFRVQLVPLILQNETGRSVIRQS
jgi:hypothetical protein